jgi:hypothetical protein
MTGIRFLAGTFSPHYRFHIYSLPTHLLFSECSRLLFEEGRLKSEAGHPSELKNAWSFSSTLHTRLLGAVKRLQCNVTFHSIR